MRAERAQDAGAKRPDIQIVGDELHPLLKVTDFAPYIAKIKASGADTVITGNWGQDFALLLKAAADAGLQVNWYTYYAGGTGGPTAVKQASLDHRVFAIAEGVANEPRRPGLAGIREGVPRQGRRRLCSIRARSTRCACSSRPLNEANSLDPVKVAAKLDGMKVDGLQRRRGLHAQGRSSVLPADVHRRPSATDRQGSRSTRRRPAGAGASIGKIDTAGHRCLPTTCKMNAPELSLATGRNSAGGGAALHERERPC